MAMVKGDSDAAQGDDHGADDDKCRRSLEGGKEAEEAPPGLYVYLPGSIFHHSTATQTDGVKRNSKKKKKTL